MTGKQINQYRILSELGRGGMGVVYLSKHQLLGRKSAIKTIHKELTLDNTFRERFFTEAKIQASLEQANFPRIETFFQDQNSYFLVMEYVPGLGLDELLETEGSLPESKALGIFKQVLQGMQYAHCKGLIHRDIKPSNIRVTPQGTVKILDLGIAKILGGKSLTKTGTAIGTPEYMSPEQIKPAIKPDYRTDIYSAGIVLYEMLTGDLPFKAEKTSEGESTDFEVKEKHLYEIPPDPRERNPEISGTMAQIILKALEKDPRKRYSSCTEFLRIIEAYERGEDKVLSAATDEVAVEEPPKTKSKKPKQSNSRQKRKAASGERGRWPWWVAIVVLFLVFGSGLMWFQKKQEYNKEMAKNKVEIARIEAERRDRQKDDIAFEEAIQINTKQSYYNYLKSYQYGKYSGEARYLIGSFNRTEVFDSWMDDKEFQELPFLIKREILLNYFDKDLADESYYFLSPEAQDKYKRNFITAHLGSYEPVKSEQKN